MKKLLAIVLAVVMVLSLAACGGGGGNEPTKAPTYPKHMGKLTDYSSCSTYELYLWNEHTEAKVYTLEWVPNGFNKESGEKLPAIIYVHGNTGGAESLRTGPVEMAKSNVAGFSMECCGASNTAAKSDKGSASTTSRVADLDTVFQYVKSLPWVDQNQIYIYGQSHGGVVVMYYAPHHNDDVAGVIIESSGVLDETAANFTDNEIAQFAPETVDGWKEYIKGYNGDVIICDSQADGAHEGGLFTNEVYNQRTQGTCTFYSCPEGGHGINSFSEEGIQITFDAIRKLVLGE